MYTLYPNDLKTSSGNFSMKLSNGTVMHFYIKRRHIKIQETRSIFSLIETFQSSSMLVFSYFFRLEHCVQNEQIEWREPRELFALQFTLFFAELGQNDQVTTIWGVVEPLWKMMRMCQWPQIHFRRVCLWRTILHVLHYSFGNYHKK